MKCLFEMSAVSLAVLFLLAATDGASVAPSNGDNVTESLRYLDHANATQLMRRWVRDHPGLAALYEVGRSVQGRELWVLKVAADVAGPRPVGRPMFKWVANMHGDEAVGRVVVLAMAEYLLKNYPADPEVKALLESVEFHLMPSMNPDGFDFSLRDDFKAEGGCSSRQGRRNTNGVDLNRNFPSQWRSYRNLSESREPETVAVMKWILENPFVLSGNMHGGSVVASYPFDDSKHHLVSGYYSKCPDDEFFRDVALTYASKHDIMKTGVPSCPGSELETFKYGITNGAHWYDVEGGMQDFNYVHSNCFEMTFELTCCKFPPEQTMKAEWLLNKRPMLDYMKKIHMGVKGVVTDGRSGKPVNRAVIVIQNIDKNVTTTERGEFWRLLVPGTYVVTVAANGYELETTEVTVPKEGYPVVRDFSLTPIGKREPSDASATYAVVNSTAAGKLREIGFSVGAALQIMLLLRWMDV